MQDDAIYSIIPGQLRSSFVSGEELTTSSQLTDVHTIDLSNSKRHAFNVESHEQLSATFQEECDAVLGQLRQTLRTLFDKQLQRMMSLHFENGKESSSAPILPFAPLVHPELTPAPPEQRLQKGEEPSPAPILPFAPMVHPEVMPAPPEETPPEERFSQVSELMPLPAFSTDNTPKMNSCDNLAQTIPQRQIQSLAIPEQAGRSKGPEFKLSTRGSRPSAMIRIASQAITRVTKVQRYSELERTRQTLHHHAGDDSELIKLHEDVTEQTFLGFVRSSTFEACAAILLFSNIALLGVQVEMQANALTEDDMPAFKMINAIFCVAFMTELALRIYVYGNKFCYWSPDFVWSWFDLVVVIMQVVEVVIAYTTSFQTGSTFSFVGRLVRIARVARVVRAIRIMRFLHGFKVLVDAIYATVLSCVWALMLLMIIIYVFSLIFAQFASDFLAKQDNARLDYPVLDFYFGNFTSSMFTLFKSIVGGIDWEVASTELTQVGSFFVLLFIVYVTLMQFAVINVIAGLFLQSAIEQAEQDQDHVIQVRLKERQFYVERLKNLFSRLDSTKDGFISLAEFEAHLQEEQVQAFFGGLGIENADAWTIFKLLDEDGGGDVDYLEFVEGCIRLRGHAKSIEIAQLMYHHKWIMEKVCELSETVHEIHEQMKAAARRARGKQSS